MREQCAGLIGQMIPVSRLKLHVVEEGSGEIVLLLHGFPEFWYSWRHQFTPLAEAGFRVVAPDLPGYNKSDAPSKVATYRTRAIVTDVAELIRTYGCGPVNVVGHDWGGLIAWRLASLHPNLVRRLVILNAPHPMAFQAELRRNPKQWIKSAYTLFFQLPWLPERVLSAANFAVIDRGWQKQPLNPEAFTDEDISMYKHALKIHGLTPPLNYYRAALRYRGDLFGQPQRVLSPTLVVWGEDDPFMSSAVLQKLTPWVPTVTVRSVPRASHWVQNDAPQLVNKLLIEFLQDCGSYICRR